MPRQDVGDGVYGFGPKNGVLRAGGDVDAFQAGGCGLRQREADAIAARLQFLETPGLPLLLAAEGDGDVDDLKSSFKFPHHAKDGGPANLGACRNGLARMSGADIPPADDAGVQAHLNAHLSDGGSGGSADHAHHDLSGISPEQLRAALKGAGE